MLLSDRILYIDAEAMVLDKPAGLPVDAPRDGSLSLENHLDSLRLGFRRHPLAVHRLDRDTSGCLLLARNPKAHKKYAAAFEAGVVGKTYWAVLAGVPEAREGVIDMPLKKVSTREEGWRMVHDARGKSAVTRWEVLAEHDGRALVAFMPQNGRTHQIRVHAASGLGAAIVGDPVYGAPGAGRLAMLLHARRLVMPRDGKPAIDVTAALPVSFALAGFADPDAAPEPDAGAAAELGSGPGSGPIDAAA